MEQRATTTPLQRTRFWLILFSSANVVPVASISAVVFLRQVCLGRPTFRFPCGFQSRACLVMLDACSRSVWPIHPHLRFLISVSVGVCFILSRSCSFETTSGNLMLRVFLRHLLVNKGCRLARGKSWMGQAEQSMQHVWPHRALASKGLGKRPVEFKLIVLCGLNG